MVKQNSVKCQHCGTTTGVESWSPGGQMCRECRLDPACARERARLIELTYSRGCRG